MATFVYSVLVLVSIAGNFVPHVSITVAEALLLVDLAVLIYFIHHIATSIQLPEVIAGIARDLHQAVDAEFPIPALAVGGAGRVDGHGPGVDEITDLLDEGGVTVPALRSGYLQFVGYGDLVRIAEESDAVIRLTYRPGHFVVAGRPLATVWPPNAAAQVATALDRTTSPVRTGRSSRTRCSPSTSWWRSPSGPCRRPSTTPSPRSPASTGCRPGSARSPGGCWPRASTATGPAPSG